MGKVTNKLPPTVDNPTTALVPDTICFLISCQNAERPKLISVAPRPGDKIKFRSPNRQTKTEPCAPIKSSPVLNVEENPGKISKKNPRKTSSSCNGKFLYQVAPNVEISLNKSALKVEVLINLKKCNVEIAVLVWLLTSIFLISGAQRGHFAKLPPIYRPVHLSKSFQTLFLVLFSLERIRWGPSSKGLTLISMCLNDKLNYSFCFIVVLGFQIFSEFIPGIKQNKKVAKIEKSYLPKLHEVVRTCTRSLVFFYVKTNCWRILVLIR